MRNDDWGVELRKAHSKISKNSRPLRFPSGIELEGDCSCVSMVLSEAALHSNMQTNAAAFEVWALALHVWCGVKRLVLKWESTSDTKDLHYQRFLYRATKFKSCFSWLEVENNDTLRDAEAINNSQLILNVRKSLGKVGAANPEAALERKLSNNRDFKDHCGLVKIGTQFPVGLFRDRVANGNHVFPGGASAIDIVGLGPQDSLWLFELKADKNIPAGIISELLFYTWIMQDTISKRFTFESETSADTDGIQPADILICKTIEARFIGREFHPLLDGDRILNELNSVTTSILPAVHFGKIQIIGDGSADKPFQFQNEV